MDDILEIIVEIILEIIMEGSIEAIGSKKVPLAVRLFLAGILLTFFLGVFGLLFYVGIQSQSVVLIWIAAGLFVAFGILAYRKLRKFKSRTK